MTSLPRIMTKRFLISKILFPTAIAVIISYFMLSQIQVWRIPQTLESLPIPALVIGFILYCLFVWTKALRFRELLRLNRPVKHLFPILALHTFWGNILPMRSGDVSYIYLMKQRQQVGSIRSVASLLLASIIDLTSLIGLMIGTGWLLRSHLEGQLSYVLLFLIPTLIGVSLISLITVACLAPNLCITFAERIANPFFQWNIQLVSWSAKKCLEIIGELTQTRLDRRLLKIWTYSIASLCLRFGFQCYLVREMGVAISVLPLLFGLAFTNVFNLLPIQSIGNFGTVELPFAWALTRFGTSEEVAIVSGFSLHLIILLYCLPLGVYGAMRKSDVIT